MLHTIVEYETVTLYGRSFQSVPSNRISCNVVVLQPHIDRNLYGLGSSPFARHY